MDENLQKTLQQRMTELPPDIQEAIRSADFTKKLQSIGQKYLLHIDQLGTLENEVLMVMLGFVNPEDLVSNIVSELKVPLVTANLIATDVSQELFLPIRESMKKFSGLAAQPTAQPIHPVQPTVAVASAALQQPTVTPVAAMPPAATDPNKPTKQYSTDPYHEPIE